MGNKTAIETKTGTRDEQAGREQNRQGQNGEGQNRQEQSRQEQNQRGKNGEGQNRREQNKENERPAVEVLIPVYKPGVELAALLEKMRKQSLTPTGVHLLVTAGEDEFGKICERYTRFWEELGCAGAAAPTLRFTRISPEAFDHGGTRHRGAAESTAEVLLFMTQDAVPADAHLVENLVRALGWGEETAENDKGRTRSRPAEKPIGSRPSENLTGSVEKTAAGKDTVVAVAYARQLPAKDGGPIEWFTRSFNYPQESAVKTAADLSRLGIKTFFCSNVCAAYRRDIYDRLGGFCRRTIFNEDMIFAAGLIKAGYGVAYAAKARVVHSHNYSGWQQVRRNFDLAVSQADHPEVFAGVASEGEGIRMVKKTAAYLCKSGHAYLLPKLFWQSGCKYLGYLLGKNYRRLPRGLVRAITMNQRYWHHEKEL